MGRSAPDQHVVPTRPIEGGGGGARARDPGGGAGAGGGERARGPGGGRIDRGLPDRVVVAGLLVLAAALRFVFLEGRGTWDADQGHDMLVLQALVSDGAIPLLGPPTSIGDFHHGAAYYYLLAPFALLSGADPVIVVGALAAAGAAAVAVVWWLVRSIAGPLAGAIAGLLLAVSPSAIEASTFLWNPNAIGLSAALALAAAWRAQATGTARWWLVAGFALGLTMQLHVLGLGLAVPIVGLFAWTWRRAGLVDGRRGLAVAGLGALALILVQYVPLAIHEATSGFSETRAALDYLGTRGPADQLDPLSRFLFVALRIVSWPVVGLITDAPIAGLIVAFATGGIVIWRWRAADPGERLAVRWFGLSIAWSAGFLAVAGRGLTTVVPGLPNDHYHAFVDPMIVGLIAIGLARLAGGRSRTRSRDATGRAVAAIAVLLTIAAGIGQWPPVTAPDGGWPAARAAGERISATTGARAILLGGLPLFKSTGAYAFPLVHAGRSVDSVNGPDAADEATIRALEGSAALVVACDRLFESVLLATCGDDAEGQILRRRVGFSYVLADRFDASTRTVISVYLPMGGVP